MALTTTPIFNQSERYALAREAIGRGDQIVIPDLQSKSTIRKLALNDRPVFDESLAPRSREFWLNIYKIIPLETKERMQFVPRRIVALALQNWLGQQEVSWAKSPQTANELIDVIEVFFDLLVDAQKFSSLIDWLKENSASLKAWAHLVFLAESAVRHLRELNFYPDSVIKEYLLIRHEREIKELRFPHRLVFDLGSRIDESESELIKVLSSGNEVVILKNENQKDSDRPAQLAMYRFEHELSEKKMLSRWRKEKRDSESYSIVSNNARADENLINVLAGSIDLGQGSQLAVPELRRWINQLLTKFFGSDYERGEFIEYVGPFAPHQRFEDFYAGYWLKGKDRNDRAVSASVHIESSFEEFVFSFLFDADDCIPGEIGNLVHRLTLLIPPQIKLAHATWVRFLISELGESEGASRHQQHVLDYDSLLYLPDGPVFFSQLSESVFKPKQFFSLVDDEAFALSKDLGWLKKGSRYLNRVEQFGWILQQQSCRCTFFEVSIHGQKATPSLQWLRRYAEQVEKPEGAESNEPAELKPWVRRYLSETTQTNESVVREMSITATGLERYLECPFIIKAEKLFKLQDPEVVGAEIGARSKGTWLHALANRLAESRETSATAIREIVLAETKALALNFYDDWFATVTIESIYDWALRYAHAEARYREEGIVEKIIGHEVSFKGQIARSGDSVKMSPLDPAGIVNGWKFSGRIDRLESAGDQGVKIIDYKAKRRSEHTNSATWIKNDQLQLALYSLAIENGLAEIGAQTVQGALYYFLDQFERNRGMALPDANEPGIGKGGNISEAEKAVLYAEALKRVSEILGAMERGEFFPKPRKPNDCPACNWKDLCRAPHLS